MFLQEVRHIFRINFLLQKFQKHWIVYIAIVVLSSQLFILFSSSNPFLCSIVQHKCNIIIPSKNSKLNSCQSIRSNKFEIPAMLKQIFYYPNMISFCCSDQWYFACFSWMIDLSMAFLNKKANHFQISIIRCPIKWSHFGILCKFVIQQVWSFFQHLFNIGIVLSVDVIQEVLAI